MLFILIFCPNQRKISKKHTARAQPVLGKKVIPRSIQNSVATKNNNCKALLLQRGHEKLNSKKSKLSGSIPSPPKPQQLIDGLASHRLKSLINQDNVKLPLMVPVPTHKFFANVGRPTFIKRELRIARS